MYGRHGGGWCGRKRRVKPRPMPMRDLDKSAGGANPLATLPDGGKSKQDAITDAGLSLSQAYRYQELAGPRYRACCFHTL